MRRVAGDSVHRHLRRRDVEAGAIAQRPGVAVEYQATSGAKRHTGVNERGRGDQARVFDEFAALLKYDGNILVTYPNGPHHTTMMNIFESREHAAVICAPGCLFKPGEV